MDKTNRNPVAVLISDVHYSLRTLTLADTAFRLAIDKAAKLGVPLIDCGDVTNDKAMLRAEVVNTMLRTMNYAADKGVNIFFNVGNHSLLNEKSTAANALDFLLNCENCTVIKSPASVAGFNFTPYQPTREAFLEALSQFPKGSRIIAHQGITKAWPGEYCHDHSAAHPEDVADYRIISGHYHRAQEIKCGKPRKNAVGLYSYVGNPYTLTFAEAEDGPKGFRVLYNDGLLDSIYTDLRKHIIVKGAIVTEGDYAYDTEPESINKDDLVWFKMAGPSVELAKLNKKKLGETMNLPAGYRLDLIPTDVAASKADAFKGMTHEQTIDRMIETSEESGDTKSQLKKLWREILS